MKIIFSACFSHINKSIFMDLVMINKFKDNMWMHDNESRAYNPSFLLF